MIATRKRHDGITLRMTSAVEYVSPLGEALHALCLYATGSECCALDVQRAVVEALNNVILHAYSNQAGNEIIVQWCREKGYLRIEVIDFGLSMSSLPTAVLPAFDAESGRGWWIIHSCVDDYYYKVVECIERERVYKPEGESRYFEDIIVKSHSNILTLIKQF
jgi:anti-sigma regulatory factor (Ser/Thr protein kinase)